MEAFRITNGYRVPYERKSMLSEFSPLREIVRNLQLASDIKSIRGVVVFWAIPFSGRNATGAR